jgi:DNA-nicking Smr family endonuclease
VDFGDILDQWEQGQWGKKKKPAKSPGAPESRPEDTAVHPLTRWLNTHEVYDKDAEDPESRETGSSAQERRRLLALRPNAVIDLHGLTRDQAWNALEHFFETGRQRGYEKLAIIHGKGNHSPGGAVLKRTVREFIERCPFAGQSGHGGQGGTGATWVLLKPQGGRPVPKPEF